jgi:hypothetical protein
MDCPDRENREELGDLGGVGAQWVDVRDGQTLGNQKLGRWNSELWFALEFEGYLLAQLVAVPRRSTPRGSRTAIVLFLTTLREEAEKSGGRGGTSRTTHHAGRVRLSFGHVAHASDTA